VRSPAARQVTSAWHSASAWHDAHGEKLPVGEIAGSSSRLLTALVRSVHTPNAGIGAVSGASAVSSAARASSGAQLGGAVPSGAVPGGVVPGAPSRRGSSFAPGTALGHAAEWGAAPGTALGHAAEWGAAPGTALGHAAEWGAAPTSGGAVVGGGAVVSTLDARGNAHLNAEMRELRHALSDGAPSLLERRLWKAVSAADCLLIAS
jgi:hypothetical protein